MAHQVCLTRFSLDALAASTKKKVIKEILARQEYFECVYKETGNNSAAKLTPQKIKKSNYKSHIKDTLFQFKTERRQF